MWNDEDNNPYSSFDRPESAFPNQDSDDHGEVFMIKPLYFVQSEDLLTLHIGFERSSTPNSDDSSPHNEPPEFISRPKDLSDDEDYSQHVPRKKGSYDSRLEQILCEDQDLQILITDAGKSHENGGSYIAYTIRTGV